MTDQQPEDSKSADDRAARLVAFARFVAGRRDEAVRARSESGIEDVWSECEEAYAGIDDLNRHEHSLRWFKPGSMAGGLVRENRPANDTRATGFVRLTSKYVDAGAAKAAEITIPVDGKSVPLKATPVPEALQLAEDDTQFIGPDGLPKFRPAGPEDMPPADPMAQTQPPQQPQPPMPGGAAQPMPPGQPPQGQPGPAQVPLTHADLAKKAIEKAEAQAKKAETRIHDWLVECSHPAQMRKVIFDGARIGVGVLKGPVPDIRRSARVVKSPQGVAIETQEKLVPITKWLDPWNLFPDPACGENIHDGDYVLERDYLSPGKLEALKRNGFYINSAIDKVLHEGPGKILLETQNPQADQMNRRKAFEIWYYYGRISFEELEMLNPDEAQRIRDEKGGSLQDGAEGLDDDDGAKPPVDSVHAVITLVNDTPIRVSVNLLETGSFPYRVFSWRRRAGFWAGVGVAEQVRFPQRLVNAATRAGMTNAAKSAGGIVVVNDQQLRPMDGQWVITPDKLFGVNPDQFPEDVQKAIAVFDIPNQTAPMMAWIDLGLRLAEESTNIPLVTQGQSGKTTPDTFGGQQLQDNNANQLLRDVGYSVAENITNWLGKDLYDWLLMDPEVPDDEKGDAQVDVNGALAMIEKALQDRQLMMLAASPMTQDPGYGFDKRKVAQVLLRNARLAPSDLMMTDAEFDNMKKQPPPPPPQIAAAQIRAASTEKIEQGRQQLQAERNKVDLDRDTRYNEVLAAREQIAATKADKEMALEWQLALLKYANERQITLDQAKVDLATTTMELRLQKDLAGKDGKGPQVTEPPVEPEGRAEEGMAYQA